MLLLQNLLTALEQVWANKLRSVLTVLGVIIAVTSTIVVVAVVQGFSGYVTDFLQGIGTNAIWVFPERPLHYDTAPLRAEINLADVEEVDRSAPAVRKVSPLVIRQVKVNCEDRDVEVELQGVSEDFQDIRKFYAEKGRCFGPLETENRRQVCVLGREGASSRPTTASSAATSPSRASGFRVLGILEKKGSFFGNSMDNVLLVPYTTALDMFPDAERQMAFMAQAESAEHVPEAKAQITDVLQPPPPPQPGPAQRLPGADAGRVPAAVQQDQPGGDQRADRHRRGVAARRRHRHHERHARFGHRADARDRAAQAIGARRRDILAQFLTEAVVLSTSGGLIGILLGYAITYVASLHPDMVDIAVPYWAVLLGVGFSVGVGVVFGLLPAFKAAILQPIDALRYE